MYALAVPRKAFSSTKQDGGTLTCSSLVQPSKAADSIRTRWLGSPKVMTRSLEGVSVEPSPHRKDDLPRTMTLAGMCIVSRLGTYWNASSPIYLSERGSTTELMSVSWKAPAPIVTRREGASSESSKTTEVRIGHAANA
eukprot:scaffold158038_cov30-Tisochrysis_lutea.AAC.4